jgi:hypothetical protein
MGQAKRRQQLDPTYGKVRSPWSGRNNKAERRRAESAKVLYSLSIGSRFGKSVRLTVFKESGDAQPDPPVRGILEFPTGQILGTALSPLVRVQDEPELLQVAQDCSGLEGDERVALFMVNDLSRGEASGMVVFAPPYNNLEFEMIWMESNWPTQKLWVIEDVVREALAHLALIRFQQSSDPEIQPLVSVKSA